MQTLPGQTGHQCLACRHPTAGTGTVPRCPEAARPRCFLLRRSRAEQPPPPSGCSARSHAPSPAFLWRPCRPAFWWWLQTSWSFSHFERLCRRVRGRAWLWDRSCCCCCRWREEEGLCAWCGATWSGRRSRHSSTARPGNCKEKGMRGDYLLLSPRCPHPNLAPQRAAPRHVHAPSQAADCPACGHVRTPRGISQCSLPSVLEGNNTRNNNSPTGRPGWSHRRVMKQPVNATRRVPTTPTSGPAAQRRGKVGQAKQSKAESVSSGALK